MKASECLKRINAGALDGRLVSLYGEERLSFQRERYAGLCEKFTERFKDSHDVVFFSSPGRCEIIGNHTDHNKGKVIAASVDRDNIALAARVGGEKIQIYSTKNNRIQTSIGAPKKDFVTSSSYVEGVAHALLRGGYRAGGFIAVTDSDLPFGIGMSSSASFELLIGKILSFFYNGDELDLLTLSKAGQLAETEFCKKPCGLMDQLACALGGISAIDFSDDEPKTEKMELSFDKHGYRAFILNTGSSHSRLSGHYAAITREMALMSALLGVDFLRRSSKETVLSNIDKLRRLAGDRAVTRALHYFDENERVDKAKGAIASGDIDSLLALIDASGRSSVTALQNIYPTDDVKRQEISVALTVLQSFLDGKNGVCRVHGGGFGGSVLSVVKESAVDEYTKLLKKVFLKREYIELKIRSIGLTAFE